MRDHVVGDVAQQLVALGVASSPRRTARSSRIFRLTSWSEQSTPAELSMKSALMRPPADELDPRALREAEVAALAHHAAAQLSASTRIASLERSSASASVSVDALTTVPMPPFQSRSTARAGSPGSPRRA